MPVYIAASGPAAARLAGRIADGFIPLQPIAGTSGYPETVEKIHGWLRENGRDPSTFGIEARVIVGTGSPVDWRKTVEEWRTLGATHLGVATVGVGPVGVDAHIKRLREAREVLDG